MNKLQEVVQKFRSGSVDSDKSSSAFALSGDDAGARSRTYSSTDSEKKDHPTASPRRQPGDPVWVTTASHPGPFSPPAAGGQGQPGSGSRSAAPSPGYLADLSLQSTPVTSGTSHHKDEPPKAGASTLSAQELRDSVLSALGGEPPGDTGASSGSVPPPKASLERKASKRQQPKGTFVYMVKDGDTLVKIGAHFDVTPSELVKINRLVSRTVFVGQTLYIPDPNYVPSDPPTPKSASPIPDNRPKVDIPLVSLADRPMPSVPGHAVQVTSPTARTAGAAAAAKPPPPKQRQLSHRKSEVEDEPDRECLQKFLKMPVRRVLEEDEELNTKEGFTIKGTLLVTPNAVMFDPDVNDPVVIDNDAQAQFSMVVYMEEIKSVALFHDISPRMFWRQPKELRAHSPKPETYRSTKSKRPKVEGQDNAGVEHTVPPLTLEPARPAPDGASAAEESDQARVSPIGGEPSEASKGETTTGRTSEELEAMTEITGPEPGPAQPGRTSEEIEHAMTQPETASSPLMKQMSRSSELEVSEIVQFQEGGEMLGQTRDFGPHMGRSSSEVHRQISSSLGRVSDASPGDPNSRSFLTERSDSTTETVSTPTQGFAPLHFTDRSPKSVTAHPKPVPGQRAMLLSQDPVPSTDLKSQENRIAEDAESLHSELHGSGHFEVSTSTDDQLLAEGESSNDFSNTMNLSATDTKSSCAEGEKQQQQQLSASDKDTAKSDVAKEESSDMSASNSAAASSNDKTFPAKDIPSIETATLDKLARQMSDSSLGSAEGQDPDEVDTSKPLVSPRSSFSPLRAPAQHISSFFNYTSSFFRSAGSEKEKTSSTSSTPPHSADSIKGKSKSSLHSPPSSSSNIKLQLRAGFTKEDISKVLGPDPKNFLPRSDSPHFEENPLYLQIRPGIQKDKEILQPRAFDHRNVDKMLEEYWFVVPRDMGDKLYSFLMEWQPEAYGDQEDTETREKFFYDVREVQHRIQPVKKYGDPSGSCKAGGDSLDLALTLSEDHFSEDEKTWEILSKDEAYGAEKSQAVGRQDTIDESTFPELLGGPSQILDNQHIWELVHVIPRTMTAGYNWELVYGTHKHGYSLQNLYTKMEWHECDQPVLLFIRDSNGCVFGAYLSNTIHPSETFYGSGSSFLFTFYEKFKKYAWSGENQFFMNGTKDFFAIGSGTGLFGLWVDGDLNKGRTHRCATFNNEVLSKEEDFIIIDLEVWRFIDSSLS